MRGGGQGTGGVDETTDVGRLGVVSDSRIAVASNAIELFLRKKSDLMSETFCAA